MGSTCLWFGALASLLSRRTHFLALIGLALFGASIFANGFVPSTQYIFCCAAALKDLSDRLVRIVPTQ